MPTGLITGITAQDGSKARFYQATTSEMFGRVVETPERASA